MAWPLPTSLDPPLHLALATLEVFTASKRAEVFLTSRSPQIHSLYLALTPTLFTCLFILQGPLAWGTSLETALNLRLGYLPTHPKHSPSQTPHWAYLGVQQTCAGKLVPQHSNPPALPSWAYPLTMEAESLDFCQGAGGEVAESLF